MQFFLFFLFFFYVLPTSLSSSISHSSDYLNPTNLRRLRYPNQPPTPSQESIELTPPLPTAELPPPPPQCTMDLLRHSFAANTKMKAPYTVIYSPPFSCPGPWAHAVLHLNGSVNGENTPRVAAVWLAGVEIMRTSTPEPFNSGTFWHVQKDITRYSFLLQQSNVPLSIMLENLVDDYSSGVYEVNLSLMFFKHKDNGSVSYDKCWETGSVAGGLGGIVTYENPADLVIPVAAEGNGGFWFKIVEESHFVSRSVMIPQNARRIVLEMYVSFHGDDEYWYSNPPNRYIVANNITTNQGNGAFREVYVRVDGQYVASEIPFPVIFPGGLNPLFWKPVVAIGAFNMPSYDFDLTPFLGSLADGKRHKFELGVAHATQFWYLGANLHVWLEGGSSKVESNMIVHRPPNFLESWIYNFKQLDGFFQAEARRDSLSSGWTSVSCGNLTTIITRNIRFRNMIMFSKKGTYKTVQQQVKTKTQVRVLSDLGVVVVRKKFKSKNVVSLIISTVPRNDSTTMITTNISIASMERFKSGLQFSSVKNTQKSGGWMLVKDDAIVSGKADTQQLLSYRGSSGCFVRNVGASGGRLLIDDASTLCPTIFRRILNVFLNLFFHDW